MAAIRASSVVLPSALAWFAKSTIRIAFFATKPINMIIPRIEKMFSVLLVKASANSAPIIANGIENITTNGYA
ncbi:hypothetical protein D3C79_896330 [compost metagenome]